MQKKKPKNFRFVRKIKLTWTMLFFGFSKNEVDVGYVIFVDFFLVSEKPS